MVTKHRVGHGSAILASAFDRLLSASSFGPDLLQAEFCCSAATTYASADICFGSPKFAG
jgi:hypothetical protein